MRVLLLNPPSDRLALRDYYCSTYSKANYLWHPIDLLAQSGILSGEHDVAALDAVAEALDKKEASRRAESTRPEIIFSLTSAATWRQDMEFLEGLKNKTGARLILSGEIFLDDPAAILEEYPSIDGALLNFISHDAVKFINGDFDGLRHMAWRSGEEVLVKSEKAKGVFSLPLPRHDLFPMTRYRMPWQMAHPFATVMTDFGCPFDCKFCNSGTFGYALRDIDNLAGELDHLKSMGIKQLFIKDMTFGGVKKHARAVLNLLIDGGYGFKWNAYTRADLIDEEMADMMARAGCHLLQIGVESADEAILERYDKKISTDQTVKAFRVLKEQGIDGGAHFIIGLPGDTRESIRKTADLAIELDPVYASFNMAMPRLGTRMQSGGWKDRPVDSSGGKPFYDLESMTGEQLMDERRRAMKRFYIRPGYWLRAMGSLKTSSQAWNVVRQALGILSSR